MPCPLSRERAETRPALHFASDFTGVFTRAPACARIDAAGPGIPARDSSISHIRILRSQSLEIERIHHLEQHHKSCHTDHYQCNASEIAR